MRNSWTFQWLPNGASLRHHLTCRLEIPVRLSAWSAPSAPIACSTGQCARFPCCLSELQQVHCPTDAFSNQRLRCRHRGAENNLRPIKKSQKLAGRVQKDWPCESPKNCSDSCQPPPLLILSHCQPSVQALVPPCLALHKGHGCPKYIKSDCTQTLVSVPGSRPH
jgi:hypothetical protein